MEKAPHPSNWGSADSRQAQQQGVTTSSSTGRSYIDVSPTWLATAMYQPPRCLLEVHRRLESPLPGQVESQGRVAAAFPCTPLDCKEEGASPFCPSRASTIGFNDESDRNGAGQTSIISPTSSAPPQVNNTTVLSQLSLSDEGAPGATAPPSNTSRTPSAVIGNTNLANTPDDRRIPPRLETYTKSSSTRLPSSADVSRTTVATAGGSDDRSPIQGSWKKNSSLISGSDNSHMTEREETNIFARESPSTTQYASSNVFSGSSHNVGNNTVEASPTGSPLFTFRRRTGGGNPLRSTVDAMFHANGEGSPIGIATPLTGSTNEAVTPKYDAAFNFFCPVERSDGATTNRTSPLSKLGETGDRTAAMLHQSHTVTMRGSPPKSATTFACVPSTAAKSLFFDAHVGCTAQRSDSDFNLEHLREIDTQAFQAAAFDSTQRFSSSPLARLPTRAFSKDDVDAPLSNTENNRVDDDNNSNNMPNDENAAAVNSFTKRHRLSTVSVDADPLARSISPVLAAGDNDSVDENETGDRTPTGPFLYAGSERTPDQLTPDKQMNDSPHTPLDNVYRSPAMSQMHAATASPQQFTPRYLSVGPGTPQKSSHRPNEASASPVNFALKVMNMSAENRSVSPGASPRVASVYANSIFEGNNNNNKNQNMLVDYLAPSRNPFSVYRMYTAPFQLGQAYILPKAFDALLAHNPLSDDYEEMLPTLPLRADAALIMFAHTVVAAPKAMPKEGCNVEWTPSVGTRSMDHMETDSSPNRSRDEVGMSYSAPATDSLEKNVDLSIMSQENNAHFYGSTLAQWHLPTEEHASILVTGAKRRFSSSMATGICNNTQNVVFLEGSATQGYEPRLHACGNTATFPDMALSHHEETVPKREGTSPMGNGSHYGISASPSVARGGSSCARPPAHIDGITASGSPRVLPNRKQSADTNASCSIILTALEEANSDSFSPHALRQNPLFGSEEMPSPCRTAGQRARVVSINEESCESSPGSCLRLRPPPMLLEAGIPHNLIVKQASKSNSNTPISPSGCSGLRTPLTDRKLNYQDDEEGNEEGEEDDEESPNPRPVSDEVNGKAIPPITAMAAATAAVANTRRKVYFGDGSLSPLEEEEAPPVPPTSGEHQGRRQEAAKQGGDARAEQAVAPTPEDAFLQQLYRTQGSPSSSLSQASTFGKPLRVPTSLASKRHSSGETALTDLLPVEMNSSWAEEHRTTKVAQEEESPGDRFMEHHRYQFLHYIPVGVCAAAPLNTETPQLMQSLLVPLHSDRNGLVWLVQHRLDGMPYAVKEVLVGEDQLFHFKLELEIFNLAKDITTFWGRQADRHIARYYSCCRYPCPMIENQRAQRRPQSMAGGSAASHLLLGNANASVCSFLDPNASASVPQAPAIAYLLQTEYFPEGTVWEWVIDPFGRRAVFAGAGAAANPLEKCPYVPVAGDQWSSILTQCLMGLRVLHEYGYVHGYPLLFNFYIHDPDGVKLSNFGAAQKVEKKTTSHFPEYNFFDCVPQYLLPSEENDSTFGMYETEVYVFCQGVLLLLYLTEADQSLPVMEVSDEEHLAAFAEFIEAAVLSEDARPAVAGCPINLVRVLYRATQEPRTVTELLTELQQVVRNDAPLCEPANPQCEIEESANSLLNTEINRLVREYHALYQEQEQKAAAQAAAEGHISIESEAEKASLQKSPLSLQSSPEGESQPRARLSATRKGCSDFESIVFPHLEDAQRELCIKQGLPLRNEILQPSPLRHLDFSSSEENNNNNVDNNYNRLHFNEDLKLGPCCAMQTMRPSTTHTAPVPARLRRGSQTPIKNARSHLSPIPNGGGAASLADFGHQSSSLPHFMRTEKPQPQRSVLRMGVTADIVMDDLPNKPIRPDVIDYAFSTLQQSLQSVSCGENSMSGGVVPLVNAWQLQQVHATMAWKGVSYSGAAVLGEYHNHSKNGSSVAAGSSDTDFGGEVVPLHECKPLTCLEPNLFI